MTREDIIKWAQSVQMPHYYQTNEVVHFEKLERFAKLVAAAEREACAKLCDQQAKDLTEPELWIGCAYFLAVAIRARGKK